MTVLIVLLILMLVLLFTAWPVRLAAGWVGAGHTGWVRCFVSAFIAGVIGGFATRSFHVAGFLVIFISGFIYMIALDTTYVRGVIIAVLQIVLIYAFVALFGSLAVMSVLTSGR